MVRGALTSGLSPEAISGERGVFSFSLLVMICSFSVAVILGSAWEEQVVYDGTAMLLYGAGPREMAQARVSKTPATHVYQRIRESDGLIIADYGFLNFNNDPLTVAFSINARELAAYNLEYGYTRGEKLALDDWQKKALEEAYQNAVKNHHGQEQLNRAGERVTAEYKAKLTALFHSRGFITREGNLLVADIPEIVRRNVQKLRSVAISINKSGERLDYDSDSVISAAVSLVQTALRYENIPSEIAGRKTGGILPPLETIASGRGDCDTKVALLGSILLNWNRIKIIGVGVPGHYLMGVMRNPAKGDVFMEYKGARYVLIEPAGPGWLPPGSIDSKTAALLNANANLRIEPFN